MNSPLGTRYPPLTVALLSSPIVFPISLLVQSWVWGTTSPEIPGATRGILAAVVMWRSLV